LAEDEPSLLEARNLAGTPRIIGGSIPPINTYPWFAKALTSTGAWQGCGGTLVTPEFVLTAAHCISSSLAKYQIGAYCNQAGNCGQASQIVNVAAKYVHNLYKSRTNVNDFALVKLASRVNVTNPVPNLDQGTVSPNYPSGKMLLTELRSLNWCSIFFTNHGLTNINIVTLIVPSVLVT
jgi:secreted trypsin-like serine protease